MNLLPLPRQMSWNESAYELLDAQLIHLQSSRPQELLLAAYKIQQALLNHHAHTWQITAAPFPPAAQVGITLSVSPGITQAPQGYELKISAQGIAIRGADPAGVFYGACTLVQILEKSEKTLPGLVVRDWPDFPVRGVMLDISRDKVPQMATLYDLIDLLASWKINQVQLYMEHTFAYLQHPAAWANTSPVTGEEILALDAYCRERFVELVPNQNSFGHLHHWLELPEYNALAEAPAGCLTEWGPMPPFSLDPQDPASLELLRGLYDELLPHFSSRQFNVGCDETIDLGLGKSRAVCEQKGKGRVYFDFLMKIYREVRLRGRTMQFWGDIILQHPEFIPELPKDIVALEWGYEFDHPFAEHGQKFAEAGIPFYVCPGTSAWCSLAGRTSNALANLLSAAENGLKHGATGYLNTDWGDNGHWQPLPASYLGFAAGAAYSWALEANRSLSLVDALNHFAFADPSDISGRIAYDLGEMYQFFGGRLHNGSPFFRIYTQPLETLRDHPEWNVPMFMQALERIDQIMAPLEFNLIQRPDAPLLVEELELAAWLMRHACQRAIAALAVDPEQQAQARHGVEADFQALTSEYSRIWLLRNRPGGLSDSLAKLAKNL